MVKQNDEFHLVKVVNKIITEIDSILETHKKEKYFEGIILLYNLIENLLKWSVFIEVNWIKAAINREIPDAEAKVIESFCGGISFDVAIKLALALDIIDYKLYKEIDSIKRERNVITHELWIWKERKRTLPLKKKLRALVRTTERLTKAVVNVSDKIGVDEIFAVRPRR